MVSVIFRKYSSGVRTNCRILKGKAGFTKKAKSSQYAIALKKESGRAENGILLPAIKAHACSLETADRMRYYDNGGASIAVIITEDCMGAWIRRRKPESDRVIRNAIPPQAR